MAPRTRRAAHGARAETERQALLLAVQALGVNAERVREAERVRSEAERERDDLLEALLGALPADAQRQEVFVRAAARGKGAVVRRLLRAEGVLVDAEASAEFELDRETALTAAAKHGEAGCVKLLLAAGADAERRGRFSRTPLICAAECGSVACVEQLLEAGAAVGTHLNNNGETAHKDGFHSAVTGNLMTCSLRAFCLISLMLMPPLAGCLDIETDSSEFEPIILDGVHDPGQMVSHQGQVFLAASAVETWMFDDSSNSWKFLADFLYEEAPSWDFQDDEGEALQNYWAPSTIVAPWDDEQLLMYHSAVSADENTGVSRIGFATSSGDLNDLSWTPSTDFVVESTNAEGQDPESRQADPFAIDPSVFFDSNTNEMWLLYGSHASGIYLVELDPTSGYVLGESGGTRITADDHRATMVASRAAGEPNNIEAAYIYHGPEFYYLFTNWDVCCNGINSTYNIRVGRSTAIEGPYFDDQGLHLNEGGGRLFIDADGETLDDERFHGPGHVGVFEDEDGTLFLSHHFYDGALGKDSSGSLAIWGLDFENGWPVIDRTIRFGQ